MDYNFLNRMEFGLAELEIDLSEKQMCQFFQYYEDLIQWNSVMNLTAITQINDVVDKHFIDSLSLVKALDDLSNKEIHIIDVGTGAGFPGIPLKIAFPQLTIILLDSLNKRVSFLNEVIENIGMAGIEAIHGRAEDLARMAAYRENFDLCVSRAVSNIATLSEYCLPFTKVGGKFIAYKSEKIEEELAMGKNAISVLGGKLEKVIHFPLAGAGANRALVVIGKKRSTSKKYPRKAGTPLKEPIK